jgi:hypothetical protein
VQISASIFRRNGDGFFPNVGNHLKTCGATGSINGRDNETYRDTNLFSQLKGHVIDVGER